MTASLAGTIALVTGAAGGIGRATCRALAAAGATVVATDRTASLANVDDLGADLILPLDVTDETAWASVMAEIDRRYNRLDCLVNNAGIAMVGRFEDTALETWRRCQSINVDGTFLGIRAAVPLLRKAGGKRKGGASIVNLSSVAGLRGAAFNVAYCTSKGAVRLLTKAVALEFSALGYPIRVNSVHPGGVATDMMEAIMGRYVELGAAPSVGAALEAVNAQHPIGRMAEPEEIAAGIVFLCSDEASYMRGSELVIDGGFSSK